MAQLVVRKLEPEVARLEERAARKGRSAEEEHRATLREALLGGGSAGTTPIGFLPVTREIARSGDA